MNYCKFSFFIGLVLAWYWLGIGLVLAGCSHLSTQDDTRPSFTNLSTTRQLLNQINFTINHRLEYQLDQQQYGLSDYWAAPIEALESGKGDCEDYAFLKRELLIRIGVPKQKLKLLQADVDSFEKVVNEKQQSIPHIVLAYYADESASNPLILDNTTDRIKYLRSLKGFHLNYIFNEESVWKVTGNNRRTLVNNTDILPKFTALQARQKQYIAKDI